jgi:ABC-type nitrate/sulfonate/bicarbonate transport system permease component
MTRLDLNKTTKEVILRLLVPLILILIWYFINKEQIFPSVAFPAPIAVLVALKETVLSGELFKDIFASLRRVAIGYSLALSIAIPLGLVVGWYKKIEDYVNFTITLLRQIPSLAWIPLVLLWFGMGEVACLWILIVASFFPTFLNTILGVKEINPILIQAALTLGAKRDSWFLFKEVVLPGAIPAIITGMRISLIISWMAIIAGEMAAGKSGLGYMIQLQRRLLRGDKVILGMLVIALIGFIMDKIIIYIESRLLSWQVGMVKRT